MRRNLVPGVECRITAIGASGTTMPRGHKVNSVLLYIPWFIIIFTFSYHITYTDKYLKYSQGFCSGGGLVRENKNAITAFVDASNVYGSTHQVARNLRRVHLFDFGIITCGEADRSSRDGFIFLNQSSKKGQNSSNTHGSICSLGHKFQI